MNVQKQIFFKSKVRFASTLSSQVSTTVSFASQDKAQLVKYFPSITYYSINGEWVVKCSPKRLIPLLTFLKYHTGTAYSQLRDLTAIDHPERKQRFEVVYQLLSVFYNQRLTVSVALSEGQAIQSSVSVYASSGWYERETWDRFGVYFSKHPDRRRRLTDYGFKGHPLRKDFPLTGFVEVRYDDSLKRVLYEKVSLPQEYRLFTLGNSWGFSAYKI